MTEHTYETVLRNRPRLQDCLDVAVGERDWKPEELKLREIDPGFLLNEAEANAVLATFHSDSKSQYVRLTHAVWFISELPTQELQEAGVDCLRDVLPDNFWPLLERACAADGALHGIAADRERLFEIVFAEVPLEPAIGNTAKNSADTEGPELGRQTVEILRQRTRRIEAARRVRSELAGIAQDRQCVIDRIRLPAAYIGELKDASENTVRWDILTVRQAFESLTQLTCDVFDLKHFAGLSKEDIQISLDLTLETVNLHLLKAKKAITEAAKAPSIA